MDVFKDLKSLFFKTPISLQRELSSFTDSELRVYMAFIIQIHYRKKVWIEATTADIAYWTGIKNPVTVRLAIRGLAVKGWIKNIKYQKNSGNVFTINLEPKPNEELIKKMDERSKNTSIAKKKSIKNGEKGKFEKVENEQE